MTARVVPCLALSACLVVGCVPNKDTTQLVPDAPFGAAPAAPAPVLKTSATVAQEVATRVGMTGQKVVTANKHLGLTPVFKTIGAPKPEVFHHGSTEVIVTEGLVKLCTSEAQLAAVLSLELGKIVAERQALAPAPGPDRPPLEVRVGSDGNGSFGPADQTHLFELARYEQGRKEAKRRAETLADPKVLARGVLVKAGYKAEDLDAVEPVLRAAQANYGLEKQINAAPPARPYGK